MRLHQSLLLCAATLGLGATAEAQEAPAKSDLRVLVVAHDPATPRAPFGQAPTERTNELYAERAAAWESFLNEHFASVRLVHGPDYVASMSDTVDVTLFDTLPTPLTPVVREPEYKPATYLPDDFSRPALMIADNSPRLGEPLGLKLDWL